MAGAFKPLANLTLSSSQSSVTFSNISQVYTDLVLVMQLQATTGYIGCNVYHNSDTNAANYYYVTGYGNGSSATGTASIGTLVSQDSVIASDWSFIKLEIQDYSLTNKHKIGLVRGRAPYLTEMTARRWASTSAISSITISASSNAWAAGSTFALYGVSA